MASFSSTVGFLNDQMSIFGPTKTKEEGMKAAVENANPAWLERAKERLAYLCSVRETVSADDLREDMQKFAEKTNNYLSLGALFSDGISRGLFDRAPIAYVHSRIPQNHRRKIPVYRSKIFSPFFPIYRI